MGITQAVPKEKDEAKALVQMLKWRNIQHWHIPNENSIRDPRYMSSMKSQGWNKGIADYFIMIPLAKSSTGYPVGLFVELKRACPVSGTTGKKLKSPSTTSPEQEEFIRNVTMIRGVHGEVCYGADDAIAFIDKFLK